MLDNYRCCDNCRHRRSNRYCKDCERSLAFKHLQYISAPHRWKDWYTPGVMRTKEGVIIHEGLVVIGDGFEATVMANELGYLYINIDGTQVMLNPQRCRGLNLRLWDAGFKNKEE